MFRLQESIIANHWHTAHSETAPCVLKKAKTTLMLHEVQAAAGVPCRADKESDRRGDTVARQFLFSHAMTRQASESLSASAGVSGSCESSVR